MDRGVVALEGDRHIRAEGMKGGSDLADDRRGEFPVTKGGDQWPCPLISGGVLIQVLRQGDMLRTERRILSHLRSRCGTPLPWHLLFRAR